jgi:hypothetical protein
VPSGYRDAPTKRGRDGLEQSTLNAITEEKGNQVCKLCGRKNHTQRCAFQPSSKNTTHPLIKALNGQPFEGSNVQRRLRKAFKWKEGQLVASPYQCIPFGETLKVDKDSGKDVLIATDDGPARPETGKGKRSHDPPENTKKVSWDKPSNIPPYCVYKDDLSYLFLNTSSFVETASQENVVTATAVSVDGDDKQILKTNKVLLDTGAIHYNYIKLDVVRKYKFKRFKLQKYSYVLNSRYRGEYTLCIS